MIASKLPWVVLAGIAGLMVVGFATYFAVNAGDSSGSPEGMGTPPPTASTELPTTPAASSTPVETPAEMPPTEPPPTEPPPTTGPTATETPQSVAPPIDCERPMYRLDADRLRAHPLLYDAVVTVVDKGTVQIDFDGITFFVRGWGKVVRTSGPEEFPEELLTRVTGAIDAVRYEC
jgi:hypothetical protein